MRLVKDERIGPRAPGEGEDAAPVGDAWRALAFATLCGVMARHRNHCAGQRCFKDSKRICQHNVGPP